jgi:hypothetical protein
MIRGGVAAQGILPDGIQGCGGQAQILQIGVQAMAFQYSPKKTDIPHWHKRTTLMDARLAPSGRSPEAEPRDAPTELPLPAAPTLLGEAGVMQTVWFVLSLLAIVAACAGLAWVVLAFHEAASSPVIQEPLGDLYYGPIP